MVHRTDFDFRNERLEVDPSKTSDVDFGNIVKQTNIGSQGPAFLGEQPSSAQMGRERPNSEDFVDDPDVPPLE